MRIIINSKHSTNSRHPSLFLRHSRVGGNLPTAQTASQYFILSKFPEISGRMISATTKKHPRHCERNAVQRSNPSIFLLHPRHPSIFLLKFSSSQNFYFQFTGNKNMWDLSIHSIPIHTPPSSQNTNLSISHYTY